jgi:5-formyltetrahydrofolate cyclo-ligase
MMTKDELRAIYKKKRSELSELEIEEKSIAIANRTLKLNIWNYTYFHVYLTIKNQREVNTELLMHVLQGKDKQIVISKSDFQTFSLKHFLLTDSTPIRENKHGIPEPQDGLEVPVNKIDVVFVPLLAFDKHGNRVGYGKGFYDRFLKNCREDVVKIGLSFFKPEESIETDEHDINLDFVVTPDHIFRCH